MYTETKELSFAGAINEALHQSLNRDPDAILIGQGVKSPWYVGSTCNGLLAEFGENRVIDTPVSENAVTGAAVGAAIAGTPTIVVHPRVDFMLYAFDPIINEAANWRYMSGGASGVPVVFWGIINRGGEQAAQHSQSLHAMFAHCPGLKVVMPSNPRTAKGLMVAAINDPDPVVYIDDRSLYGIVDQVPADIYETKIGQAEIAKEGTDITLVGCSAAISVALQAAISVEALGISCEVIDLLTVSPLDVTTILNSVSKTKRLLAVDGGWESYGVCAEVISRVAENFTDFCCAPQRLALPNVPAPASSSLEEAYYIGEDKVTDKILSMMQNESTSQ